MGFKDRFAEGAKAGWNGLQVMLSNPKNKIENNLQNGMKAVNNTLNKRDEENKTSDKGK